MKVVLIVDIFGACRRDEIIKMSTSDVEDLGGCIKISVPDTKTKVSRQFVIIEGNLDGGNMLQIIKKYSNLRHPTVKHYRFFGGYRNGKCISQPVGINTIGDFPKRIAIFLGLPNSEQYTGHCLRRSSASLLADVGVDTSVLKRHGGWKSSSVAEGYVENSLENKKEIATKILGRTFTSEVTHNLMENTLPATSSSTSAEIYYNANSTTNSNEGRSLIPVQFNNLTNCTVHINYN